MPPAHIRHPLHTTASSTHAPPPASINIITSPAEVLPTALALARTITSNSPDAVQSTKEGLLIAQHVGNVDEAVVSHALSAASGRVWNGQNIKEGLAAFVEKRTPKWTNPAKL